MRLMVIGDSHVHAYWLGESRFRKSAPENMKQVEFSFQQLGGSQRASERFFELRDGGIEFTEPFYRNNFQRHNGGETIFRPVEGTRYAIVFGFHTTRVVISDMWEQHAHWQLGAEYAPAGPISDQVMQRFFERDARHIIDFYAALVQLEFPFVAVSSPPPRGDHPTVSPGRTPATVYLDVNRRYREFVTSRLTELGIPIVFPPEQAYGDDGFLRPEHYFNQERDPHHANGQYGGIALQHVVAAALALEPRVAEAEPV